MLASSPASETVGVQENLVASSGSKFFCRGSTSQTHMEGTKNSWLFSCPDKGKQISKWTKILIKDSTTSFSCATEMRRLFNKSKVINPVFRNTAKFCEVGMPYFRFDFED
eukprot:Pompholyxophrys_punicea_v1_NODE_623_length_1577_cov_3.890276.p4 type:complete len:110 gc:universal NODE_623_length_1577_cov_3.890276:845-1174(+)